MSPAQPDSAQNTVGPVILCYDGTDVAADAIGQAAGLLDKTRDALVVCVWQPVEVGFTPIDPRHVDADRADQVGAAAAATAEQGAALARTLGFLAEARAIESTQTWRGLVEFAERENASVIVLGSVPRRGVISHLLGSVAAAVVAHSSRPVLILSHRT